MTDAPSTNTYILVTQDNADLPASLPLHADPTKGFGLTDNGAGNDLRIDPTVNLLSFSSLATTGFISYNSASSHTFVGRTLGGSSSINISNADGLEGQTILSVIPNSTVQQINVQKQTIQSSTRSILNFIPAEDAILTIVDNGGLDQVDITLAVSVTPNDATYILETPDSRLTHSFALSSLATGLLKKTGAGNLSIATPNVDYVPYSAILESIAIVSPPGSQMLLGNGAGFSGFLPGISGEYLGSTGTNLVWLLPQNGTVTSVNLTSSDGTLSVTGSPITSSGSINIDLPIFVTPGSFVFSSIIVDEYGRIENASSGSATGTVTSVNATSSLSTIHVTGSSGLPITSAGTIQMDIEIHLGAPANTYTNPNLIVDSYGRITQSRNGTNMNWSLRNDPFTQLNPCDCMSYTGSPLLIIFPPSTSSTLNPQVGDFCIVCITPSSSGGRPSIRGFYPSQTIFNTDVNALTTSGNNIRPTVFPGPPGTAVMQLMCVNNDVLGSEEFILVIGNDGAECY